MLCRFGQSLGYPENEPILVHAMAAESRCTTDEAGFGLI